MHTQEQKTFQRSLIISGILHLIFAVIFIFGLPSFSKKLEQPEVMIFEMVTAADLVNIKNQNTKVTKEETEESKKVVQKPTEQEAQPEEKAKPEEVKEKEPEKEPEIIPEKKIEKKEPEKKEKKKEVAPPKKEKEKPKPKKPAKQEEDPLDKIMKELEKESEGQSTTSLNKNTVSKAEEGKFATGNHDGESPLSVTEKLLIKKQIEEQWQPPVGAASLEEVQVILHLKVLEDGTISEVKIKEVLCPTGASQTCDLVAHSAARAAKKASPLKNLRPNRYDIWKEFDLRFDPSNIMK
jgi:outer membrane biosynthesis protein TonB